MALGTKFRIEGTSDIFGKVTVNIKLNGYTGSVIDLDGVGRNWVELKIGDNSNDISNPILPGKLTVQFYVMADFATTELGRSESFTYYVEALDGLGDLIWAGWAIPDEYKEAYHNTPYIATLVASDGLEELKNVNYFVQSGKVVLFDHIQNCLTSTQLDLPFFESINIYSNGMDSNAADSPLKQAQVTYNSFLNISETPNKYDVLRSILQPFLARIYQYRGWRIENILEKRGSYVVREYDSTGAYVDQETFDPLVKFDTDYADYRAFIQKTGQLSIRPSLNNAEVYFNTVEPAEETATGGFQKAEDWTSSTELVEWTAVGSNITIEQVTSSFDGNEFAVKIPGKRSSLEQTNYLESNSYPINSADYETINIEFAHYADYPSIIILGSKPILYFEIIFTETAAADSYNWTGSAWELIPTGQPRKRLRIDFSNRQRWTRYSVSIDRVPADGDIKFRFYKLIKSGSEGVTELRLTAWKSNLVIQEPRNAKILLEYASGQAITTYKGPSFAHIISDGLILNAAGVMDVDNVLTDQWSRRGITDQLNIRRLFLLQWLSFNATPTELLSGTIHQKGEVITPMSVVKDKDAVSSVRYVMQSWNFSLSNGIGAANYREILLTDTNINAFQDFVDSIRFGDYFSFTTISPIFIFGAPGLSDGANTGPFELPNFTLNGDVRGQLGQSELTPAAIVNKARLDLVGLTASDIVFNAVKDSPDQENMTNLRLIDTYDVLDETFVPYTGAKDDVDLGAQGITTEWVKLNTTPAIPTDQGSLYWDEDDNVLAVVLNGAIQKVGEVTFYNVKNQTGSTIAKGTGVGFAGVVGLSGRIKVAPFLADGSQPSIYYVGITAEEILNGEDGKVYNFGPIRGLNTSAFSEGDVLYASSTVAGGFTTTPPTAPNNVIVVAAVLADSATVGALLVRVTVGDLGGGGRDDDAVHYDAADSKNATERNQARVNIGSTSATPQVIATAGAIDDLTITSNSLVFTGASVVLSGIVAGLDGEEITILNVNASSLSILNQSTLSTASNRIIGAVLVPQFSNVRLKYRTTTNRWTLENVGINDGRYLRKDKNDNSSFGIGLGMLTTIGTNSLLARSVTTGQNAFFTLEYSDGSIAVTQRTDGRFQIYNKSGSTRYALEVYGEIAGAGAAIFSGVGPTTLARGVINVKHTNAAIRPTITVQDSLDVINGSWYSDGSILIARSTSENRSVRRDELPFNYHQTVTTSGTINDLSLANEGVKLLILTLADDLTGVVPVTTNTGRLLRIEGRNATGVIIRHDSASSTAANRFSIGSDLTIATGEIYTFIYTNARWRRVL